MYSSVASSSPRWSVQFAGRVTLLAKIFCACLALAACAGTTVFTRDSSAATVKVSVWQIELCPAGSACTSNNLPQSDSCPSLAHAHRSVQAFAVLAVLASIAAVVLHLAAMSPSGAPLKFVASAVHASACVASAVCWALEAALFNQSVCGGMASLFAQGYQYSVSFALMLCACMLQFIVILYTAAF
jgi:hypothetical protein